MGRPLVKALSFQLRGGARAPLYQHAKKSWSPWDYPIHSNVGRRVTTEVGCYGMQRGWAGSPDCGGPELRTLCVTAKGGG